ncbi:MAG: T9SS type A sorting domain-containing protein [Nonlabens sp.]
MGKITFLFFIFLMVVCPGNAQDTCATAQTIMSGTYNVANVNGTQGTTTICSGGTTTAAAAEWYTYTPTNSGSAIVSSNILPTNMNGDTRLQIYEGTCGALVCVAGSDDVDYPGGNYLSEVTFNTTANTTYYIVWDNRWSSFGFEFTLTESIAVCLDPFGFVADDNTSTTYDLSWTDTNTGTPTWEIEWGADGFTQGTGTLVSNIMTTSYQFTGLTANTNYDFFIRTNCGGSNGDSAWVGPISFRSQRDCTGAATLPYSEDFADGTVLDCFAFEDADMRNPIWSYNTNINDLDGDGTTDSFMVVFPQSSLDIAKDDWLFSEKFDMTTANTYSIEAIYNAFDLNNTSNESFELYITDSQTATAPYKSLLETYSGITQSGVFGDTNGNDLITQAYTATETFIPPADGTYYVAIRATTTNSPNLFMLLNLAVTETAPVNSAPSDISLSPTSINQSSTGVDATVATLSTTDADSGDTHTYSLVSGTGDTGNANFNISGNALRSNGALLAGNYSIRVNTNDGTDDFEKQFSIIIVDDISRGLQLDAVDTNYTIDFDNTVAGVNNGTFAGSGLDGIPSAGQLNSKGFFINGLSDGDTTDGGTFDSGDYARGASTGGLGGGGLYAFDVSNGGTADIALGVQATGSDFTLGEVILRVENNTGSVITTLDIAYEIHTLNNETRSQSITLSHGGTAAASNSLSALDYATEEAVFTPLSSTWKANYFTTQLTGLSIADGVEYFIKWSSGDLSGSGSRDEFALDDIQVIANSSTAGVTADAAYQDMKVNGSLSLTQATDIEGGLNISGGTLNTNDNLTFKSINYSGTIRTAILEEVQNGGSITGNVTVEQFYPANRAFRFVASPVFSFSSIYSNWQEGGSSTTGLGTHITGGIQSDGFDQSTSGNPSLFVYNSTAGTWQAVSTENSLATNSFPMFPTIGFRMFIRGDRMISLTAQNPLPLATETTIRSTGELVLGDVNISENNSTLFSTPFGPNGSFVLIGNPYQAPVDLSQTLNATNSDDVRTDIYYAWQPITENYVTYDFAVGGTVNGVTRFIQPGQSFFVQTDNTSDGSGSYDPIVSFKENQKGSDVVATATYSIPEASYAIRMFDVTLAGGSIANDLVRGFINTGANNSVDNQDAVKIYGMREQLSVLASGTELSIERRDHFVDGDIMPLRISQMEAGNYIFELEFNGLVDTTVELVDNHIGAVTPIAQNQIFSHSFDIDLSDAGSFASDRFYVRFTTGTLSNGDVAFAKAVQLYPNPVTADVLNISGLQAGEVEVSITNMLGQKVIDITETSRNGQVGIAGLDSFKAGVYLVNISQGEQSTSKKVVIK